MDNSVPGYTTRFAAFVNPVVCWGGLLAVLACAVQAVRRRCARALFIVIGYLAQLVPWFFIGRITFAYHYFPSVLFLILALCYVFYSLSEQEELIAWKPAMYAITAGPRPSTPCSIPCWWASRSPPGMGPACCGGSPPGPSNPPPSGTCEVICMYLSDYHTHSRLSFDAHAPLSELAEAAADTGPG